MADGQTPVANSQPVLIKKREQISDNNKKLFLWVAGASVIVSFAIVASIFLSKQLFFTEKVLSEKGKSSKILRDNIESAKALNKEVNNLRSDRNLKLARATTSDNNLDVVIDALPYDGDEISLGASLQNVIMKGIAVDSLSVSDVAATSASSADNGAALAVDEAVGSSEPLQFSFKVNGTVDEVKQFFNRLNHSIRPIKVISLRLDSAGPGRLSVSSVAQTYYQPSKVFNLIEKTVSYEKE